MERRRVASGRWVRLADSEVFALPSHPGTWLRQCMAATLSVPASGVSGVAGAALLDFPGWPRAHVEVVTKHGTTNRSPFATVRQSDTVGRFVVVEGIRVVSPADCVMQLAAGLDAGALGELVDEVATRRRHLLAQLRERYVALAGSRLPGIARVRTVLEERGDGYVPPDSELTRALRRFLSTVPGLPPVEWEATPRWLEPSRGRVDAFVPDWRLVVEADGRAWHTRVADFEYDRWRDNTALAHGCATVRFTWSQLSTARVECRNLLVAVGRDRSGSGGSKRAA